MINKDDIDAMKGGRVIGFCGLAGSGKSTARDALMDNGWASVSLANPLKAMVEQLLIVAGINATDAIYGHLKETPFDVLGGKSPRQIMQLLGTEWGRGMISPSLWVDIARHEIKGITEIGYNVVIDDVRFENEADLIREFGGYVVEIKGRGGISGNHVSESGVDADMVIHNLGDINDFKKQIVKMFA